MEFSEVIRRRRMIRHYSSRPLAPEVIERVLANALRAPSAGFAQGPGRPAVPVGTLTQGPTLAKSRYRGQDREGARWPWTRLRAGRSVRAARPARPSGL